MALPLSLAALVAGAPAPSPMDNATMFGFRCKTWNYPTAAVQIFANGQKATSSPLAKVAPFALNGHACPPASLPSCQVDNYAIADVKNDRWYVISQENLPGDWNVTYYLHTFRLGAPHTGQPIGEPRKLGLARFTPGAVTEDGRLVGSHLNGSGVFAALLDPATLELDVLGRLERESVNTLPPAYADGVATFGLQSGANDLAFVDVASRQVAFANLTQESSPQVALGMVYSSAAKATVVAATTDFKTVRLYRLTRPSAAGATAALTPLVDGKPPVELPAYWGWHGALFASAGAAPLLAVVGGDEGGTGGGEKAPMQIASICPRKGVVHSSPIADGEVYCGVIAP